MFTIKYFKYLRPLSGEAFELIECESPYLEIDCNLLCFKNEKGQHGSVKYTMVKSVHFCGTELPLDSFGKANSLNSASL